MNRLSQFVLAAVALASVSIAFADDGHHGHGSMSAPAAKATPAMIDGEVKKVDKEAGKITIKHGPIEERGMPGMTMVFRVKDPAMFDQVKAGDKVRFKADTVNGAMTLTTLESTH
ncbi:copper-binding protein [Noviherbaspirillum agri]